MKILNNFIKNAGKPTNTFLGKMMLAGMNHGHNSMALWCIDKYIKPTGREDILDVGCGGGQNIANFLKRTSGKVYGIDYSEASVAKSLKKNRKATQSQQTQVLHANTSHIPFESNAFDIVTAFETIYFWSDIANDFKEIKRVLKSGGKFVVCNEASKAEGNERWTDILDMNIYTPEEVKEAMLEAGFENVQIFTYEKTQRICVIGQLKNEQFASCF